MIPMEHPLTFSGLHGTIFEKIKLFRLLNIVENGPIFRFRVNIFILFGHFVKQIIFSNFNDDHRHFYIHVNRSLNVSDVAPF
jgi:hypothetical protein